LARGGERGLWIVNDERSFRVVQKGDAIVEKVKGGGEAIPYVEQFPISPEPSIPHAGKGSRG